MPRKKTDAYKEKPLPMYGVIIDAENPQITEYEPQEARTTGPAVILEKPKLPVDYKYSRSSPLTDTPWRVDTKHEKPFSFDTIEQRATFQVIGEPYTLYIDAYTGPIGLPCLSTLEYINTQLEQNGLDPDGKLTIDIHNFQTDIGANTYKEASDRFRHHFSYLKRLGVQGPLPHIKGKPAGTYEGPIFTGQREVYTEDNGGKVRIGVDLGYYKAFRAGFLTVVHQSFFLFNLKDYPFAPAFQKAIVNWVRMNRDDVNRRRVIPISHITHRAPGFPTRERRGIQKGTRGKLGAVLKKEKEQAGPVIRYGQQVRDPFEDNADVAFGQLHSDWWYSDKNGNQVDEPRNLDEFEAGYIAHNYVYPIDIEPKRIQGKKAAKARTRRRKSNNGNEAAQA